MLLSLSEPQLCLLQNGDTVGSSLGGTGVE